MPVSVVFGASGAIGRFLVPRLLAAGHDVIAVSRDPHTSPREGLRWIVGALPERIPPLPECTLLFSLGPLDAFADWLSKSREHSPRIVAIGSRSVETKRQSIDPGERELADRLLRAEDALAAAAAARGSAATVLRATLIYGAGLDRSLTPIVDFARRWHVFPSVVGARGWRQPVHAEDLADVCIAVAGARASPRTIYDVGGGERIAFDAMLGRVRESLPFATLPLPIPLALARAGERLARGVPAFRAASSAALRRLGEDLVADNTAAAADFGWAPRDFHPAARDWTPPPLP